MKVNTSTLFFAALAISGVAAAPIADALGIVQPVARHEPRDEGYCVFGCRITAILSRRQNADQLTRRDPGKGDPEYCPDGDCWTKVKTVRRQNTDQLTRRNPGKGDPEYCPDGDCWTKLKKVRRQNIDKLVRRDPGQGDGDRGEEGGDTGSGHKVKDRREALRSTLRPVGGDNNDGGSFQEPCGDNC